MPSKITLTVTQGKLAGQQFIFDCRTSCIIGRSAECNPQLPNDHDHRTISRYHCLLDINPPDIRVRDFGSKNGTYVNGKKIGQRQADQTPSEAAQMKFPEYDLQTGDEIKLGNTVFQVSSEVDHELKTFAITYNGQKQPNLLKITKHFLKLAEEGDSNLVSMRGYSLRKLLGKGGCGEVYLAQHQPSGKLVALKVMLPAVAANEVAVDKFIQEVQNTKALSHPYVVQLLDYGFAEGVFFLTREYCNGGTVLDLMQQQGGRLSVDVAMPLILQVLDGLAYAHNAEIPYAKLADGTFGQGRGLVHRDLKPSNIFLTRVAGKLIAKIGDYGLAKAFDLAGLSGQTMSGVLAGTPAFMPRQQVLNFKYAQPEVDVWAAAACLYNMLTGRFPRSFTGDPFLTVLQNYPVPIRDSWCGYSDRNGEIPPKLAEVIDLALVDDPEIYFKSAVEFKQALLKAWG